jgi:hypothetical protein
VRRPLNTLKQLWHNIGQMSDFWSMQTNLLFVLKRLIIDIISRVISSLKLSWNWIIKSNYCINSIIQGNKTRDELFSGKGHPPWTLYRAQIKEAICSQNQCYKAARQLVWNTPSSFLLNLPVNKYHFLSMLSNIILYVEKINKWKDVYICNSNVLTYLVWWDYNAENFNRKKNPAASPV